MVDAHFLIQLTRCTFMWDRSGFLVLIARCDPLHNHPHSSLSCGSFGPGQVRPSHLSMCRGLWSRSGLTGMGTIAERGVMECVWEGVRVSVFHTTRGKGTSLGCRNKGASRSLSLFCLFFPWLLWILPPLIHSQHPYKYTLPSSLFHLTPPSHTIVFLLVFFFIFDSSLFFLFSWVLIILLEQR